jgi:hypothetical protein
MSLAQRTTALLEAIAATHAWHYERNRAYRQTVAARGVGATIDLVDASTGRSTGGQAQLLPRLLRTTAQTFKSYIDLLGTPFPQDRPRAFIEWLSDQISIDLPQDSFALFRARYGSLEELLQDIERVYAEFGFEILTSSGTSGRSTIMVRDQASTDSTVESFYQAFQRYLGVRQVQRAIFVMPRQTRIAMARMASFSVKRLGLADDRIHFAIPFPADPDRVRIRSGRTFRPGLAGTVERRFWNPFMNWMQESYVTPRAVRATIELLERAEAAGEKVILFGGWVQLHAIAQELQQAGRIVHLASGSLLGAGGGLKERYPFTPAQIRQELADVVKLANGVGSDSTARPVPIRDFYGMAEGNWAAMQCRYGHYHIPPWIYAWTLDDDDCLQEEPDAVGLLAFLDPYGGGGLFPAFFKTTDQIRLIQGDEAGNGSLACPCGETGAYIAQDSIQRVDLLDEAGCAAQL